MIFENLNNKKVQEYRGQSVSWIHSYLLFRDKTYPFLTFRIYVEAKRQYVNFVPLKKYAFMEALLQHLVFRNFGILGIFLKVSK